MKISERNLPAGWMNSTLEDVAEIHDNLREPVNSAERAKRPGSYPYYGATGQVGWIDDYRQDGEFVLLGEDGAPFFEPTKEKAYLVSGKCWVNNHAHVLKGREGLCLNRYLLYALNQTNYRGYANGTTRLKLTQSAMRQLPINLAPLSEQYRIVAKIEELFSELDKGIENLKTARAQLKVYRQALLKHAFEGKLTAQWRAENQGKLETAEALLKRIQQERAERYQQQLAEWEKSPSIPLLQRGKTTGTANIPPFVKGGLGGISKPKAPKSLPPLTAEELAELPELPEGWSWVRVGEIADVQLGRQRSPNNRSNNFPTKYIRAGNLTDSGLNLEDVLDMEFEPQERARFLLKTGDVLLSEASGSANQVGKPAVWRGEIEECCFQNTVIRVRSLDELSEYLFWVFKTYYISGIFSKLSGGVGINHLSAGKLESMAIPFVTIFESEKILEFINEKLSLIENLDQTITASLQQAEVLRQSILKKAFSGQLVPQDPHDEPASKLLERIKAEKAKSPSVPLLQRGKKVGTAMPPTVPTLNKNTRHPPL